MSGSALVNEMRKIDRVPVCSPWRKAQRAIPSHPLFTPTEVLTPGFRDPLLFQTVPSPPPAQMAPALR